jgi:enoyl-CoA hydratase/carnithine racemase
MTPNQNAPTWLVVGNDTEIGSEIRLDASPDTVRIVMIEVAPAGPSQKLADDVATALGTSRIISIGVVGGTVTNEAATVLLACDLLIANSECTWDDAATALHAASSRSLPTSLHQSFANLVSPITSAQLRTLGLITEVVNDPRSEAARLADELNTISSGTLRGTKEMIDSALHTSLASALELESALQIPLLMGEEHHRIVQTMRRTKKSS